MGQLLNVFQRCSRRKSSAQHVWSEILQKAFGQLANKDPVIFSLLTIENWDNVNIYSVTQIVDFVGNQWLSFSAESRRAFSKLSTFKRLLSDYLDGFTV